MIEIWSASELREKLGRELREYSPVSISRTSVIYVLDLLSGDGNRSCFVGKSYAPQHREEHAKHYESSVSLAQSSFYRSPSHYCNKEAHLLDLFGSTNLFPKSVALVNDSDIQMVLMEYVEGAASYDALFSNAPGEQKGNLRKALLEHLAQFYTKTNSFAKALAKHRLEGRLEKAERYITVRTDAEENSRLRHYFYKFVYGNSLEFKSRYSEFYTHIPTNPQQRRDKWQKARHKISSYLVEKLGKNGTGFNQMVKTFRERYARLVFGEEVPISPDDLLANGKIRIIHGDFGPHNILRRDNGAPVVLDLNECRVAPPHVDVSLALFNLYSDPPESDVPALVYHFWKSQPEEVRKAYPQFSDFFLGVIATRLAQGIRIASCNVDYSPQDVLRFVKDHPKYRDLRPEEKEKKFKHDRIRDIHRLINFYTVGEGYTVVLEGNSRRELLKELLNSVRDFLHIVQIGESPAESYTGPHLSDLERALV